MQSFDMLVDTTREFMRQTAEFLPQLLAALVVVLFGYLLARLGRFLVARALRAVNFNVLTERAGTDHFLAQAGLRGDTCSLFGLVAFWLIILITLVDASKKLGLTYIADTLHRVVLFGPKLLIGMVVVIFGSYCARFVGLAVQNFCVQAQIPDGDMLSRLARYIVMTFVIMIGLTQIEVGGEVVQHTFLIVLGGIVLAFALAFGIGGRDWAAALLERWWPHQPKNPDQVHTIK
jgi:hypothetical protein